MRTTKTNILLLENDERFRSALADYLKRKHDVFQTSRPSELPPDEAAGGKYDLALIDLRAEHDDQEDDTSGLYYAAELFRRGIPAVIITAYPPSSEQMFQFVRTGKVLGFALKRLQTWELAGLVDEFGRCQRFPNGIAEFLRPDKAVSSGSSVLWMSVRDELVDCEEWKRPEFEEFATLFRILFAPCVTRVSVRGVRAGHGGAALMRAEVWAGDAPVAEDLAIKFGRKSIVLDEMLRYDRWVGPLPDGAAAQLRYRAETENLAAIAYSWVGDSVEEGLPLGPSGHNLEPSVTWKHRRVTISQMFSRSLDAWYKTYRNAISSRPVPTSLLNYYLSPCGVWPAGLKSLYDLHLPIDELREQVDEKTWEFRLSGRRLTDPRWFAQTGNGHKLTFAVQCPCHGDMHVRNIFALPDGSPRLIDFGRTSLGHVFRDFAALEASLRLTCVEKTGSGREVDAKALARMEDVVFSEGIRNLSDFLDHRKIHADPGDNKCVDDTKEAVRTTMVLRRAALDSAAGAFAEEPGLDQYLLAVVVHMLRYATGEADEIPKPKNDAPEDVRQSWEKRKELRIWHALYGAARAATLANKLLP